MGCWMLSVLPMIGGVWSLLIPAYFSNESSLFMMPWEVAVPLPTAPIVEIGG